MNFTIITESEDFLGTQYSSQEMLEKLIAFNTVSSGSNLELIKFVQSYLNEYAVNSTLVYNSDKTKANLFAQIGPNVPGGVILSGHTDVVPTKGQDWSTSPFALTKKSNRFYGRGTCDMKGFNALVLAAVPAMLKAGLKRPIQIALSYDEEVGCAGAPSMITAMSSDLPKAALVIVGEPTMMKVVNGHKTSIGLTTRIKGFEVHSSLMHKGVSAVMTASRLVNWLADRTEENMKATPRDINLMFEPPYTTLHVGMISGGTAANITAKDCKFSTDIRCLPSENAHGWIESYEQYAASLKREIRKLNSEADILIDRQHWVPGLKPERNGAAEEMATRITGENGTEVVSYGTEAGQFQEAGYSAIICGPGSINQAHQPNEYISEDQLRAGEAFIYQLIREHSA
ncbi:MAG: acetylornithine deacetylase [Pseudomonadota bacterium]|nr:acetylornithine deacetylase [Pseudomonadota bacterium]